MTAAGWCRTYWTTAAMHCGTFMYGEHWRRLEGRWGTGYFCLSHRSKARFRRFRIHDGPIHIRETRTRVLPEPQEPDSSETKPEFNQTRKKKFCAVTRKWANRSLGCGTGDPKRRTPRTRTRTSTPAGKNPLKHFQLKLSPGPSSSRTKEGRPPVWVQKNKFTFFCFQKNVHTKEPHRERVETTRLGFVSFFKKRSLWGGEGMTRAFLRLKVFF